MKHPDSIIPENIKGASTDTVSTEKLSSIEEARNHFQTVKKRLFSVSNWQEYAASASADFLLTDPAGTAKTAHVREGDFFRINLPAPGTESGEGYDWVQVEKIEEAENEQEDWEYALIRVRPASSPQTTVPDTAHFFSEEARSYFLVKRVGLEVSAEVHGRNEQPNTEAENLTDKIRNTFVAIGAILGISKAQWKSLVSGIVKI